MQTPERSLEHVVVGEVHVLRLMTKRLDEESTLLVLEDELGDILERCAETPPRIALNFGSVEYIFTTALAKLVSHRRAILDRGGKIGLCCLQDKVKGVIRLMRFDELFLIADTEENLLALLSASE